MLREEIKDKIGILIYIIVGLIFLLLILGALIIIGIGVYWVIVFIRIENMVWIFNIMGFLIIFGGSIIILGAVCYQMGEWILNRN